MPGKVVIHPIGIRYQFIGPDLPAAVSPIVEEIQRRLSWQPQRHLPRDRLIKIGRGLLASKEIEYLGEPKTGSIGERLARLIDHILQPLETEWCGGKKDESVVSRVKRIRMAVLPDMVKGEITEAECAVRRRQLADVYLAQRFRSIARTTSPAIPRPSGSWKPSSASRKTSPDVASPHPLKATVNIGPAIEVPPERGGPDVMDQVEASLRQLLGIGDKTIAVAGGPAQQ